MCPADLPTPSQDGKQSSTQNAEERTAAYEKLIAYAFNALSRRALSAHELRSRLLRRTDEETLADEVLARLQELGYQSDEQVAEFEARRKGVGPYRIRQKLRQRGVADEIAEAALAGRDEETQEEEARELLAKRLSSFSRKKNPRASAYAFLMRRGYPSDLVSTLLAEVESELPAPTYRSRGGWGR